MQQKINILLVLFLCFTISVKAQSGGTFSKNVTQEKPLTKQEKKEIAKQKKAIDDSIKQVQKEIATENMATEKDVEKTKPIKKETPKKSNTITFEQQKIINPDAINYKSSWVVGFRLRSDGFAIGTEFSKTKSYKKSFFYGFELAVYNHPKQTRQTKDPSGSLFGSNGIRPFYYGKQHNLLPIHATVGQKFLLAEKGKRKGVMIFFQYAGGASLGILKPYQLDILPTNSRFVDDGYTIGYKEGESNGFLDYDRIIGSAGFSKGWNLKFRPGLHVKASLQFDWAKNEGLIKALEIGVSSDFYFSKVPIMVVDNRFMFPNVYLGFLLGKRKD